jgi:hypothetical protein
VLLHSLAVVTIVCCSSIANSQDLDLDALPRPEFRGLTQKQISKAIFSREQDTISWLSSLHLVTEAYIQSLGHRQSMGMDLTLERSSDSVIDDKYFLAEVDLGHSYGDVPVERLLVGQGRWGRSIRTNTGALERIIPIGIFAMLFVDLNSFDADMYKLTYGGREKVINNECMMFSVVPIERDSGRFRGQIWVDSSSFSIVRLKGVFTGPYERQYTRLKGPGRYFHFDSRREKIGNGLWMPSVTYFDERRAFPSDGNLEFHYRGYVLLWQQPEERRGAGQSSDRSSSAEKSGLEGSSTSSSTDLVARLETDGLLAAPGQVEQRLNRIVQQIAPISHPLAHKIDCRVLLTTPAEIFAVGNIIVVSRGLLNIVPNESVLAVMLARQVAHIVLGQPSGIALQPTRSLFDLFRKKDFPGLGIHWGPDQEAAADFEAIVLLKGSPYEGTIASAKAYLSQLKSDSHRFPNLARARFGVGVIPEGSSLAAPQRLGTGAIGPDLRFENRYLVSWHRKIDDREEERERADRTTPEKQVSAAPLESPRADR